MKVFLPLVLGASSITQAIAGCPFAAQTHTKDGRKLHGVPVAPHALPASYYAFKKKEHANHHTLTSIRALKTVDSEGLSAAEEYNAAVSALDWSAVEADIETLLTDSQDFWPADYGNYGPFFVRLAWHCSGSYRNSDGRGGCAGGRQRFEPELSWDDNTNLDKAKRLLEPIKLKYGLGLSWGDLMILAGTTAIKSMGGPKLGFCAGRMDDEDGFESEALGSTPYQELIAPCPVQGNCTALVEGGTKLGTNSVGLIYVNPEGFMGNPDPAGSVAQIRTTFARMGMNDTETVALIAGGHAFGKTHGACSAGAGPNPLEQPENPWPGLCGTGVGNDTFTSGFEGPWTTTPLSFDTQYLQNLLDFSWEKFIGPGGHYQWRVTGPDRPAVGDEELMTLTADQALMYDESYKALVERFSIDIDDFTYQFSHAWYKLTTRDMGPVTRCLGDEIPPAQPFQMPLPPAPSPLPNFDDVAVAIRDIKSTENMDILAFDSTGSYDALFVRLAWQCANTYRNTDYQGGCNGARIRFEPENSWTNNAYLYKAIDLLQPIKDQFGDSLSWADLIVLSGTTALEDTAQKAGATSFSLPFTGGRSDATETSESTPDYLESRLTGGRDFNEGTTGTIDIMKDSMLVMGLTVSEYVALVGGGHSIGYTHENTSGFKTGSWTTTPTLLNTEFFENLISLDYASVSNTDNSHLQWTAQTADGSTVYMLNTDMNLKWDSEFRAVVQLYASEDGADQFYSSLASAWTKMMNVNFYDLDTTDNTYSGDNSGDDGSDSYSTIELAVFEVVGIGIGGLAVGAAFVGFIWMCAIKKKKKSHSVSFLATTKLSKLEMM